ncbi:hypothetical protein BGW41_003194 [Actinomortierella wolfii]|nr:hypothetical protein BGW41_003194 [Actinomortierella wolfii]
MKTFCAVLTGLAFLIVSTAISVNDTFVYAVKDGKLVPISTPSSNDTRFSPIPPFVITKPLPRGPVNGPSSQLMMEYKIRSVQKFWGIDHKRRNVYRRVSKTEVCDSVNCELAATETVTSSVTWKIASDVTFDAMAVKAKIGADFSVQTSTVRSMSYKLPLPAYKTGYLGFGQYWIQSDGILKTWYVDCYPVNKCVTRNMKETDFRAYYPLSIEGSNESDGIYNICIGEYDNQRCNPTGLSDISICKGNKGTIISGESLQGCKDNLCTDSSRLLVSSNNANKAVIHSDGNLCVYGTRDGQYKNTWCAGKSMDSSKGPFYGILHTNGDFCLYTKAGSNYWCSGKTSTNDGQYRAIIQNDGNFVIYTSDNNPIWSSGTGYGSIPFPYCGKNTGGGGKCHGGNPGKGDGKGGEGACCKTERDCKECCTDGVCNAACNFKRSFLEYY